MQKNSRQLRLDQPATYQIKVQGRLDEGWTEWFDGLAITSAQNEDGLVVTTLTGLLVDQGALHGLLARIRDLGIPLLHVECLKRTVS